MKKLPMFLILAMVACSSAAPAEAQFYNNAFVPRTSTAQLQARINRGVSSGRLSQREASMLRTRLSNINRMEDRMRASGGRLNYAERTRLMNQIASLNRSINRELNDFERRRVGYWNNRYWR